MSGSLRTITRGGRGCCVRKASLSLPSPPGPAGEAPDLMLHPPQPPAGGTGQPGPMCCDAARRGLLHTQQVPWARWGESLSSPGSRGRAVCSEGTWWSWPPCRGRSGGRAMCSEGMWWSWLPCRGRSCQSGCRGGRGCLPAGQLPTASLVALVAHEAEKATPQPSWGQRSPTPHLLQHLAGQLLPSSCLEEAWVLPSEAWVSEAQLHAQVCCGS